MPINNLLAAALCAAALTAQAQAAPVTFTTTSAGNGATFDFSAGDYGLGDGMGTGPYRLTVSATFADWNTSGANVHRGDIDVSFTYGGVTRHIVEYGRYTVATQAGTDSAGNAVTILSQRFMGETPGGLGKWFEFVQEIHLAPEALVPGTLPATLDLPFAARGGRFDVGHYYTTEVSEIPLGSAFGPIESASIRIASAVPEPATYAMLLTGLALAGVAARRRA